MLGAACLILLAFGCLSIAAAEQPAADEQRVFVLPAGLQCIEDEAFEETAASAVYIPEGVTEIGEKAFAANPNLTAVYLPASIVSIGDTAFAGSSGAVLYGAPGSYAEQWADTRGYSFVPMPDRIASALKTARVGLGQLIPLLFLLLLGLLLLRDRYRKPACRKVGQGRTVRRQERSNIHIQEGYFP